MYGIKVLGFCLHFCIGLTLLAQEDLSNYSKGELKDLARAAERINDSESAAIYYEAYLSKKSKDLKVVERLAKHYRHMGSYRAAENNYRLLIEEKPDKYLMAEFYLAKMLKSQGKCKEAIPHFESFRKNYYGEKEDRKYRRLAKFDVEGCERILSEELDSSAENQSDLVVKELSAEINGEHMEAAPIYLDKNALVFNSVRGELKEKYDLDADLPKRKFYLAQKVKSEWQYVQEWEVMPDMGEKEVANGAFNFEKSRFYFSACELNLKGEVDCDLYRLDRIGESWSAPIHLGEEINTKYNETQVAVGLDENERETIYFVSNRKEGKGGLDIWYSTYYEKKDKYRTPRNCGSRVNSVGDEMTPFISKTNGKMYFSSNGHLGNGGLDIFESVGQRSRWEEPSLIKGGINTPADELYYVLSPSEVGGVFVSNRNAKSGKKYCCDDLFEFKSMDSIRLMLSGDVKSLSAKSEKKLKGAKVKIYRQSKTSDERYFQTMNIANEDGNFNLPLEPNQNYIVRVEKEGYLSAEKEISTLNQLNNKRYNLSFQLYEITERAFRLENIYYEFDKAVLTSEAFQSMDTTILEILIQNPHIIVEIGSHTDSEGSDGYNQNLSQRRAESVVKYLRSKGIAKERIHAKGYGESQPVAPNKHPDGTDNPEGRALNRRTEFKVIGEIELEEDYDD